LTGVRAAVPADLDAIVALEERCFRFDRMSRRSWRRHLGSATARCFVSLDVGPLDGALLMLLRRDTRTWRMYSLAVDPSRRRAGIGRRLVEAMHAAALAAGADRVRLEVRTDNAAALAFYQDLGYVTFGSITGFYEDGASAFRMERPL
jgi:ribosomal protein S18 acetylase RimI-like enzyme